MHFTTTQKSVKEKRNLELLFTPLLPRRRWFMSVDLHEEIK